MISKTLAKLFVATTLFVGCADGTIDHTAMGLLKPIAVSAATNATPANVTAQSDRLTLKVNGTGSWGCAFNGSGSNSSNVSTSYSYTNTLQNIDAGAANLFVPPYPLTVHGLTLRLRRYGAPSGNMLTRIQNSNGTDPAGATIATSASQLITNISIAGSSGHEIPFTYSGTFDLAKGVAYAIVLLPDADATLDSANMFGWGTNNTGNANGCSDFLPYRFATDISAGWTSGSAGTAYGRSFFNLTVDTHATSGQVSWIIDGSDSKAGTWVMASFSIAENLGGSTGSVLYDIGAGSSSSTATYANSGLTLAQVKALGNLSGSYLYVRANLAVSAPAIDTASIGDGSIRVR